MNRLNQLSTNVFFRNILDTFGLGKAYSTKPGGFIPYFQYEIGVNKPQQFKLYFDKEPFAVRYKNEIFNKLCRYTVNDSKAYLAFHHAAYPDSQEFLNFLRDELTERLSGSYPRKLRPKLLAALEWVNERRNENPPNLDPYMKSLVPRLEEMIDSYLVGNIQTHRSSDLKLVVQHLYLLRTLNSKKENEIGGEDLFAKFTTKDAASLIRLHFADFRRKELNTVQKEIAEIEAKVDIKDPKTAKLYKALQDFYFK